MDEEIMLDKISNIGLAAIKEVIRLELIVMSCFLV